MLSPKLPAQVEFHIGQSLEDAMAYFEKNNLIPKYDSTEVDSIWISVKYSEERVDWIFFANGTVYKTCMLCIEKELAYYFMNTWLAAGIIQDERNEKVFWNDQPSNGMKLYIEYDNTFFKFPMICIGKEAK